MKVAMVTPYWFPIRGGVTAYVSGLAAELRRSYGVDVHIIAREGGPEGATIVGGTPTEFVRRAAEALEQVAPDVVHAHGHWYALQAALRYRRRHPGTRIFFTLHTEFRVRSWAQQRVLRRQMSKADVLTAVSLNLLERTLRTFRPRTGARVTHPGVSVRAASPDAVLAFLRGHGLEGRGPIVAFVGPLAYELKARGVERLVEAMVRVRAKYPDAILVVAGDGPYRADVEAFATRVAPGAVRFLGSLDDPIPLLSAADVYAHISFQEGLPLAVLEAMACGAPVVATHVGGIPEVLEDRENGLLVAGDLDEVADAILQILNDSSLAQRLAARALDDVATRFGWSVSAARFMELYGGRARQRVIVTVDLEKDYHATPDRFRGVEEGLPKLLTLFEKHGITAHFFVTADVCERYPDAVREVVRRGHIVGCHGESHDVAYLSTHSYGWQMASLRRATEAIERCTGIRPRGFRAPNFSANGATIRALERLGYRYDSSVLPGRVVRAERVRTLVDFRSAPQDPYHPARSNPALPGSTDLMEIPVTENPFARGGPIGLGFLNSAGVERTLEAVATSPGSPCVFVIHPWELVDPPSGPIPAWMRTGCSSDPAKLDAFLGRVRQEYAWTTFEAELERLRLPVEWRGGDAESRRGTSVFLVTNVYKPVIGGITNYVANLDRCLRDRFRVRVLAYPRFLVELEARYPRHPLRRVVHIGFGVLAFAAVLWERLQGRRVVVHSHSASFCLAVGYLGRLVGARAVHTFHSPLAYRSLTLESLSPRLDALVFVSAAVRENYADVTGTWNDFEALLPGALDLAPPLTDDARALLRAEVARRWGVPQDAFLAVFAGRVVPDKGVHVLAEAASLLGPSDGYVLVAGPPGRTEADRAYADRLPALAGEAAASGRFRCLGTLSREHLEDLFRACDVVVVPSVWAEPAPMVAIEAMAHGRPVIASSIGGLPFLVPGGQAGLLVPPRDPRALADALRLLAHDSSLRARLGSQARKQAEGRHALTRFAVEHARLYASL